jgi:hypothetical protein
MSALYKLDVGRQALAGAARSFALNRDIKDSAKLEHAVADEISTLSKGMDLSPDELSQLASIVLRHSEDIASGRFTAVQIDDWNRKSFADLKGRHVSNRRVSEIIHGTNAWLRAKYPKIHEALKRNGERGGAIGSHPFVVRHLTDRYLQHEQEAERTARRSKWPGKARADQVAAAVGPGGLLAGNPAPSGQVSAAALAQLGRRPLASSLEDDNVA